MLHQSISWISLWCIVVALFILFPAMENEVQNDQSLTFCEQVDCHALPTIAAAPRDDTNEVLDTIPIQFEKLLVT